MSPEPTNEFLEYFWSQFEGPLEEAQNMDLDAMYDYLMRNSND